MPVALKIKKRSSAFRNVLSSAKKLSAEEKQLLRLQLFVSDVLKEMKAFESGLKKKKPAVKKTDDEIVSLITSIRRKRHARASKMLH